MNGYVVVTEVAYEISNIIIRIGLKARYYVQTFAKRSYPLSGVDAQESLKSRLYFLLDIPKKTRKKKERK